MPLLRGIDDQGFRFTLLDGCGCFYTVRAERFRGFRNQSLRLFCFFVPDSFESRVISSHVASDQKRRRLYDMQYAHFGILRMRLRNYGLYGRFGEFGIVDREQDLHACHLSGLSGYSPCQDDDTLAAYWPWRIAKKEKIGPVLDRETYPATCTVRGNILEEVLRAGCSLSNTCADPGFVHAATRCHACNCFGRFQRRAGKELLLSDCQAKSRSEAGGFTDSRKSICHSHSCWGSWYIVACPIARIRMLAGCPACRNSLVFHPQRVLSPRVDSGTQSHFSAGALPSDRHQCSVPSLEGIAAQGRLAYPDRPSE